MRLLLAAALSWAAEPPPAFDLRRWMGTWHEVAAVPNGPQKGCADTVVHYRLKGDGFELSNTCWKGNAFKDYRGVARPSGGGGTRFKARFFYLLSADYWVLDWDPEYRWGAVGDGARERLWIISRSPELDPAAYAELVRRAKDRGYPVDRLEPTRREGRPLPRDPWKS